MRTQVVFFKTESEVAMNPFDNLKKKKTLLVDDDELIRDSLSIAFRNKGCFLQAAETAEEGLQALKRESFDIIISDFVLPRMNGLEFLKLATTSHPNIQKILITGYGDDNIAAKALEIGIHKLVEKPFTVKALLDSLSMMIENGERKRQAP